jgi:hypothetical protein
MDNFIYIPNKYFFMRRTSLLLNKARFHLRNADNAIHKTFPLIQENKVMIVVMNNLFMSYNCAVLAILEHSLSKKNITRIPDSFDSRLILLEDKSSKLMIVDESFIGLGMDLKGFVLAHRNSSIEFSRGEKYVLCDSEFKYKLLSIKMLTGLYAKTKLFIDEAIRLTYIK